MKSVIRLSFFMLVLVLVSCTKKSSQNTANQDSESIAIEEINEIEEVTQELEATTIEIEKKAKVLDKLLSDI